MAISLLGRNAYLFVNTGTIDPDPEASGKVWVEVDLATDVTLDKSKNEIDSTNRGSARAGWTVTQQGLKQFKVDFDAHKVAFGEVANVANDLIFGAFASNGNIEIVVADANINTQTAVPAIFATCSVGGGQESQPLDDVVTVSVSLTNSDIPVEGTYTTSVFTPS